LALERPLTQRKQLYNRYWEERLRRPRNDTGEPNEILEAVEIVLGGGRLLDVGCGTGDVVAVPRSRCTAIHGCDVSEIALRKATRRGMLGVCADISEGALPYRTSTFDWVTCLEVIEHVGDPLQLMREIHRVLQPAGQLIMTTPNIRYARNVTRLLWRGEFPHTTTDDFVWGGGHLHYFTRRDLGGLLQRAGFATPRFLVNTKQFERSWKRWLLVRLLGAKIFGEWMCGGIVAVARKP
jgi:2-polyprenyl-3-methyl-5-hydroxy-6-metoxy-1,4-benzoquinol methylase